MKRNNLSELYYLLSPFIFFLLCIAYILMLFCYKGGWEHYISWDAANTYAVCIDENKLNNWHSVVFLKECLLVKAFVSNVFACSASGLQIVKGFACLSAVVVALNLSIFLYRFQGIKMSYIFLPIFLLPSFACLHISCIIGMDYYFVAVLLTALQVASLRNRVAYRKLGYYSLLALLLILAFHLVALRKNSLLILPVIFLYFFNFWGRSRKILSVCACMVLSVFIYALANPLAERILSSSVVHPTYHMMMSDMYIAALLQGKCDQIRYEPGSEKCKGVIVAATYEPLVSRGDWGTDSEYKEAKEKAWMLFREEYCEAWKQQPVAMFSAKALQGFLFYSGNVAPSWLRKGVEAFFPAIRGLGNRAWGEPRPEKIFFRLLVLVPFAGLLYFFRFKDGRFRHELGECFSLMSAVCSVYALSFLIVTPMAELRYLICCVMLSPCICGVIVLDSVQKCLEWRRRRSADREAQ